MPVTNTPSETDSMRIEVDLGIGLDGDHLRPDADGSSDGAVRLDHAAGTTAQRAEVDYKGCVCHTDTIRRR